MNVLWWLELGRKWSLFWCIASFGIWAFTWDWHWILPGVVNGAAYWIVLTGRVRER